MRLTLVIATLDAGGAERAMTSLANYWATHGHDICLLTMNSKGDRPAYRLEEQVRHIPLDVLVPSRHLLAAVWNNVRRIATLRSAIRRSRPDCVISMIDVTNIQTLLASAGMNVPVVVSECVDPRSHSIAWPWRWLRRLLYPWASVVHAPTKRILDRLGIPGLRHAVIPYAAPECERRDAGGRTRAAPTSIVSIARLDGQKRLDLLLEAFALVVHRHPSVSLTVLGEGPMREQLEALRDHLGLDRSVRFVGIVDDPTIFLHEADLFVMSSRYEGFPNALCEAMACGVPVISTDCPTGPREIIRDGVDGILVPNGDVRALADAMDALLSDEAKRRLLAANAVEVTRRFALPEVMKQWEEVLNEVTRQEGGAEIRHSVA